MTELVVGVLVISLFAVPISIMGLFLLFASAQPNLRSEPGMPFDSSYQPMTILIEKQKAAASGVIEKRPAA